MITENSIKSTIETYRKAQKNRLDMAEKSDSHIAKTYLEAVAKTLGDVIEDLEYLLEK